MFKNWFKKKPQPQATQVKLQFFVGNYSLSNRDFFFSDEEKAHKQLEEFSEAGIKYSLSPCKDVNDRRLIYGMRTGQEAFCAGYVWYSFIVSDPIVEPRRYYQMKKDEIGRAHV